MIGFMSSPTTARIHEMAEQGASLGLEAARPEDAIHHVDEGLTYASVESLAGLLETSASRLAQALGIPERTLVRRKAAGRFSSEESEKLLRLALRFEEAVGLFEGDTTAAARWMATPAPALSGHSPLEYCRTEIGGREVESLIGRLEHGVFS